MALRGATTYGLALCLQNFWMTSTTRPLRIVVADDDRDTELTLTMLLRDEGHEVRGVSSGRHVMGAVIDFDPDVVVLDINLPGMSSWDVARTIRSRRGKKRPVLIGISGEYKHGADKVLAQIMGFDHYLLKPYAPEDLLKLLVQT
jgi:DNA-binding response OmpR family regulator